MRRYLSLGCALVLCLAAEVGLTACSNNQPDRPAITPQNQNAAKPAASAPPLYDGYIDVANCDAIHGWAWNQNDPDNPLSIEIYDGTTLLATLKANELRENLISAGKGNGKYAYTYMVPPNLKDGKPHTIRVKIAGTNFELGHSPQNITCTFP